MSPARRRPAPSTATRLVKPLAGFVAIVVIVAASVVLVRLGNGDFSSAYDVRAVFSQASAGLHPGSQVEEDGVQVGSVRQITLRHGRALVELGIASQYRLPTDTVATIEPQNLFGADQVALTVPHGAVSTDAATSLGNGSLIRRTKVLDELGQLFSSADPLLSKIDSADLATVVDELASAYGGEGRQIAASLRAGTALSALLARTSSAQVSALDAFAGFATSIEDEGPTFNQLADDGNATLPLFNAAEREYEALLSDLAGFAGRLTPLLADYRPQIDTLLDQGDNVLRVLLAQRSDLASLVQGLATYAYRFAHGASSATLPDGSRFGYFKTFIVWSDVENFVCNLLAPDKSGLQFLEPLQKAILSGNTMLDCKSQLAAFQAAQGSGSSSSSSSSTVPGAGAATTPSSGGSGSSSSSPGLTPSATRAAEKAAQALYGELGRPQPGSAGGQGVGQYLDSLLPTYSGALP